MENYFKQLNKALKKISLSSEEKSAMRERLTVFMKEHPIRHTESPIQKSPLHSSFTYAYNIRRFVGVGLVILLAFGTTTAFASEQALPGSPLYPLKLSIENVQQRIIEDTSPKKTIFAIERLERRLAEAEQLAANDVIDEKTHQKIADRFEEHLATLESVSTSAENADVQADFEATLAVHEAVLTSLKKSKGAPLDALIEKVQTKRMAFVENALRPTVATLESAATTQHDGATMQSMSLQRYSNDPEDTGTDNHDIAIMAISQEEPLPTDVSTISNSDSRTILALPPQQNIATTKESAHSTLGRAKEVIEKSAQSETSNALFTKATQLYKEADALLQEGSIEKARELFVQSERYARKIIAALNTQKRVNFTIPPEVLYDSIEHTEYTELPLEREPLLPTQEQPEVESLEEREPGSAGGYNPL